MFKPGIWEPLFHWRVLTLGNERNSGMRRFLLTVSTLLLIISFSVRSNADGPFKRSVVVPKIGYGTTYWTYELGRGSGPPPYAAYETFVKYGPGNRRCVSQLVQLPTGWWQPLKRCERIVAARL
jgi:hypothetical protein